MNMLIAVIVSITLMSATAAAQNLRWMTERHMTLFGRLGNVQSTSRQCNLTTSDVIYKQELRNLLGADRLDADQIVDVIKAIDGFSAIADELIFGRLNRREKAQRCVEMLREYGPEGRTIRGIIELPPQRSR